MAKVPVINRELKSSYHHMMEFGAWKDFQAKMIEMERDATLAADDVPINDLSIALVAESRGIRKAIRVLREHLEEHLI